MAEFGIRFDLRNPSFAGVTVPDRYRAALEMAEWADSAGLPLIVLTEHHGCDDGYLPSPIVMAAAMAARTNRIRIQIAAIVAPLHDPLRLAEDIAVADNISDGRLDIVLVNGYVNSEFSMFDTPMNERPKRTTVALKTLKDAWSGKPFAYQGRQVKVTPTPSRPGGPEVQLGGSSEKAARRAARIADGFLAYDPSTWPFYQDEMGRLGKPAPGPYRGRGTDVIHLSRDPEQAWEDLAPYALHEANSYGRWAAEASLIMPTGGYRPSVDTEALRETGQYRVLTPEQMVKEFQENERTAITLLHPMVGGLPPELGWQSLRLFETEVLPELRSAGGPRDSTSPIERT